MNHRSKNGVLDLLFEELHHAQIVRIKIAIREVASLPR